MISLLQGSQDENVGMSEDQVGASLSPLKMSVKAFVQHFLIPERQHVPGELGTDMNNSNGKVGIVNVEIVRNTPHHNEMNILSFQFPCDCSRTSSQTGIRIIHWNDEFLMSGENFSLVKT